MPKLFCPDCAKKKTTEAMSDIGKYPGEFTKIVIGRLEKDSSRCDECNCELNHGDTVNYFADLTEKMKDLHWEDELLMPDGRKFIKY
jgi:hypothetical protein